MCFVQCSFGKSSSFNNQEGFNNDVPEYMQGIEDLGAEFNDFSNLI